MVARRFFRVEKEMMWLSKKLTKKQEKFVDEYIISGNATEAARKAGYSPKTCYSIGFENLRKPEIINALQEREAQIKDARIAKQDEVLAYLSSIVRGEETEKVLIGVGKGAQKITDMDVSAKDRIKAAELLGKRYGLWTDKLELDSDLKIVFEDDYGD